MTPRYRRWLNSPRGKYWRQKDNARMRGVPFELTFEEWWDIWVRSGHWFERGNRKGKFMMCRVSDYGAYRVGNVYIAKLEQNVYANRAFSKRSGNNRAWTRRHSICSPEV